jgi:hypothetical protein
VIEGTPIGVSDGGGGEARIGGGEQEVEVSVRDRAGVTHYAAGHPEGPGRRRRS